MALDGCDQLLQGRRRGTQIILEYIEINSEHAVRMNMGANPKEMEEGVQARSRYIMPGGQIAHDTT